MPLILPSLLIVDDEPDICRLLQVLLQRHGLSSLSAMTGHDALRLISQQHFGLIFLDIKLPDAEGLELAWQIRQLDGDLPIVILSGYFYRYYIAIQQALDEGLIAGFIAKPFGHQDILDSVDRILKG